MQTAQKGHDDRGEPITHVKVDGDLAGGAGDFEHPRKTGQKARGAKAKQHQPRRVHARKARGTGGLACHADGKAQAVFGQQHIGKDHRDQRRDHAPMHAGPGEKLGVMCGRILLQVARAGETIAFRVLQ